MEHSIFAIWCRSSCLLMSGKSWFNKTSCIFRFLYAAIKIFPWRFLWHFPDILGRERTMRIFMRGYPCVYVTVQGILIIALWVILILTHTHKWVFYIVLPLMLCTLNYYKYQGQVMWNSTGHGTYRERKEDSFLVERFLKFWILLDTKMLLSQIPFQHLRSYHWFRF